MTLFETASACQHCVISVIGDHAGEGIDPIFERKKADIEQIGRTFWLMRSPKAQPEQVQGICRTVPTSRCLLRHRPREALAPPQKNM